MTIPGAPDWSLNVGQTLQYLESVTINTSTGQTVDLSSLIQPSHYAIVLSWIGSGAYAGNPVTITAFSTPPLINYTGGVRLRENDTVTIPTYSDFVIQNAGAVLDVVVAPPIDIGGTATGTLVVMALTAPYEVSPRIRYDNIGVEIESGIVNVTSGASATILAGPNIGQYYRLKCLSWWTTTAPAAIQRVTWSNGLTLAGIVGTIGGPALQQSQVALDVEFHESVRLTNNLSVTVSAIVLAELWYA